jgi:hypothetical protein
LNNSTKNFINNNIKIDINNNILYIPSFIFKKHFIDFENNFNFIIEYIKKYFNEIQLKNFLKLDEYSIKFIKPDYYLNSKSLIEEKNDIKFEISQLKKEYVFRKYFLKFSKLDYRYFFFNNININFNNNNNIKYN